MTSFTYTKDIPDAPNDPSEDQPIMQVNNNSAEDIWDVDHVGFNLNFGGTHNVVRLNQLSVAPTLQAASQSALFQRNVKGATELFYRYGNSTQNVYQVTDYGPTAAVNGESNLFSPDGSPIRIKWGTAPLLANPAPADISFLTPFTTSVYAITMGYLNTSTSTTSQSVFLSNPTLSGFTAIQTSSSAANSIYWIAIGS